MKCHVFIIASLLVASASTSNQNGDTYSTVLDAFTSSLPENIGETQKDLNEAQVKSMIVSFKALPQNVVLKLLEKGLPQVLAVQIMEKVKMTSDNLIRKTGILTSKIGSDRFQIIECAYKTAFQGEIDFICVAAQTTIGNKDDAELTKEILSYFASKFKQYQQGFTSLHSFSETGFDLSIRPLGSPETQQQLTDFLADSGKEKDQAYLDIYNNRNDPFIVKLFSSGLTFFSNTAKVDSLEGVDSSMVDQFATYLIEKMGIPKNTEELFRDEMSLVTLGEKGEWRSVDFIFKNSVGTAKYVVVLCAVDQKTDKIDFLIADIKASFELGPDIIISTSTKKKLFGLYSSTKVKVVKRPANLTEKSLQLLFNFFRLAAFEKFVAFRDGSN